MELYINSHNCSAYVSTQEQQNTNEKTFLGILQDFCMIFFKISFGYFFELIYVFFTAVNKVNSKNSRISMSVINFKGTILIVKELQVPLKWHFKSKHFSRSSRTCRSPGIKIYFSFTFFDLLCTS